MLFFCEPKVIYYHIHGIRYRRFNFNTDDSKLEIFAATLFKLMFDRRKHC